MKGQKLRSRLEHTLSTLAFAELPHAELHVRLLEIYAPAQADGLREQYEQQRERLVLHDLHYDLYLETETLLRNLEDDMRTKRTTLERAQLITTSGLSLDAKHDLHLRVREQDKSYNATHALQLFSTLRERIHQLEDTPFGIFLRIYNQRANKLAGFYEVQISKNLYTLDTPLQE